MNEARQHGERQVCRFVDPVFSRIPACHCRGIGYPLDVAMRLSFLLIIPLVVTLFQSKVFADEARFFPEKGTHFGVYYYPEHWPEEQWERDIKRVAELGFDFIHYGEFAWARLEPDDGKFDFAWMDKAVKLAADNGLKVLMSTPSPCPPAWLADQASGNPGGRQQRGARPSSRVPADRIPGESGLSEVCRTHRHATGQALRQGRPGLGLADRQ